MAKYSYSISYITNSNVYIVTKTQVALNVLSMVSNKKVLQFHIVTRIFGEIVHRLVNAIKYTRGYVINISLSPRNKCVAMAPHFVKCCNFAHNYNNGASLIFSGSVGKNFLNGRAGKSPQQFDMQTNPKRYILERSR